MTRREFLTAAAAVPGLIAIAACGDGTLSGITGETVRGPGAFDPITIQVSAFPGLQNTGELVRIPSRWFAVKRTGPSTFAAFSIECTHQGCQVNIVNGQSFDCPCHRSMFDNDGAVTQGPANQPLAARTTSYDSATDELTVS